MLDKNRIKEAQNNVRDYLSNGLLKKVNIMNPKIKNILMNNCKESLKVAEILFNNTYSDLWTIVCSYYSMYYIANAVLYKYGYKIGEKISHKVTADALIIYVKNKLKDSLLEDYEEIKEEALEIAGLKAEEVIGSFDLETTKFHLSMTSGLAVHQYVIGILCAQKLPTYRWNFEYQKPLMLLGHCRGTPPIFDGWFLTGSKEAESSIIQQNKKSMQKQKPHLKEQRNLYLRWKNCYNKIGR